MKARPSRHERGTTLIEVMIAGAVLLVAVLGFLAISNYAATATAVAHRRTTLTLCRADLIDRLLVMPRSSLATLAGYTGTSTTPQYVIDSCYDIDGRLLKQNAGYPTKDGFSCDLGTTVYQSHVAATSIPADSTWLLGVYVERMDQLCTAPTRYNSIGCSAADLRLTD